MTSPLRDLAQQIEKLPRHRVHVEHESDPLSAITYVACPPDPAGPWVKFSDVLALLAAAGAAETPAENEASRLIEGFRGALAVAQFDLHTRHRPSFDVPMERCAGINCKMAVELCRQADALQKPAAGVVEAPRDQKDQERPGVSRPDPRPGEGRQDPRASNEVD